MPSNKKFVPLSECYNSVLNGNTLNEKTSITIKEPNNPIPVGYSLSDEYYKNVLKPVLDQSFKEKALQVFLERGKQSGISDESDTITQPEIKAFVEYTSTCTNLNRVVKAFSSPEAMKRVGDRFLKKIASAEKFNFITNLNTEYGGNFTYDSYLINTVKPAMARGATRGAPGPGEAYLAFYYNGTKPVVGDLVINDIACELKKQAGRIGKSINVDDGVRYKQLYPGNASKNKDVALDISSFNNIVQQYQIKTVGDLLFGNGNWKGICGVSDKENYQSDFFTANVSELQTYGRNQLGQIIGAIHLMNYIKQVKKFKYIVIFNVDGVCIGFDIDTLGNDPVTTSKTLNGKGIYFGFKSEGGSMFDNAGMSINLK
jgi:hypothetical protein